MIWGLRNLKKGLRDFRIYEFRDLRIRKFIDLKIYIIYKKIIDMD